MSYFLFSPPLYTFTSRPLHPPVQTFLGNISGPSTPQSSTFRLMFSHLELTYSMFSHPGCQDGFFQSLGAPIDKKKEEVWARHLLVKNVNLVFFKKVVEVGRSTLQGLTIIIIHIQMEVHSIVVKVLTCSAKKKEEKRNCLLMWWKLKSFLHR